MSKIPRLLAALVAGAVCLENSQATAQQVSLPQHAAEMTMPAIGDPTQAHARDKPNILTPGPAPDLQAIIEKIAKPSSAKVQYAGTTPDAFGAEVHLPFGGGQITLVRSDTSLLSDGSSTWVGQVKDTGERAVLMLWGDALLTGYFAYKGTIYAVESLGGGVNAYAELGRQLPDHPAAPHRHDNIRTPDPGGHTSLPRPPSEPKVVPLSGATRAALEAKAIVIDVMLLYTPNMAQRYTRDPVDVLALAIEETNQTFRNSGLGNISLRLVYSQPINYDSETEDQFTHLYAMVDSLGPFEGIKKLRDEKHADIVGLIIDNPNGCGLSTRVGPDSDDAFFVVHHACATITMSIAHEIGHILGVRHDRFMDESNVPFAYGHGYVNDTKWRTIMSYNTGCGGCPRIPFWSNPRILYKGEATGTVAADSARAILEQAERISKFR